MVLLLPTFLANNQRFSDDSIIVGVLGNPPQNLLNAAAAPYVRHNIPDLYNALTLIEAVDDCETDSNTHLHTLANSHGMNIYTPSQLAATRRLQLLGHLLRHESCTEHLVSFMPSHAYRFLRGENLRQGRPRPHWAELVLTEAYRRMQSVQQQTAQPSLTCLILSFPLQQLQKYILPMALQSQIGGLMRASIDQCGKQREAGLSGGISLDNTPNPFPLAEGEHHYTMDDTTQWSSNCATHNRISLSSSLIGY